eukprot:701292-Amphidinium_carterae.1
MTDDAVAADILQHLPKVAGEVEAVREVETVGEVETGEALEPQKKRHKAKDVPQGVCDVFLSWAEQQKLRHKWSMTRSFREATKCMPERL